MQPVLPKMVQILGKAYLPCLDHDKGKQKKVKKLCFLFVLFFQKVILACRRVKACGILHHHERPKQAPDDLIHSNSTKEGEKQEEELVREHRWAPGARSKELHGKFCMAEANLLLNANSLSYPGLFLKTWAEDQNFFYKKSSSLEDCKLMQHI